MSFRLVHLSAILALVSSIVSIAALGQTGCRPSAIAPEQARPSTPEEASVDDSLQKAFDADQHGRWLDAKRLYLAALESAEKLTDSNPKKRQALWAASNAYLREHNLEQGIALAKRVVAIDEKVLGHQDPQVAEDLGQLAIRYEELSKLEAVRSAIHLFLWPRCMWKRGSLRSRYLYIGTLSNLPNGIRARITLNCFQFWTPMLGYYMVWAARTRRIN